MNWRDHSRRLIRFLNRRPATMSDCVASGKEGVCPQEQQSFVFQTFPQCSSASPPVSSAFYSVCHISDDDVLQTLGLSMRGVVLPLRYDRLLGTLVTVQHRLPRELLSLQPGSMMTPTRIPQSMRYPYMASANNCNSDRPQIQLNSHTPASLYSLLNTLPITILLISLVPAPISYSFASLSNLPAGISFTYPFPPIS